MCHLMNLLDHGRVPGHEAGEDAIVKLTEVGGHVVYDQQQHFQPPVSHGRT